MRRLWPLIFQFVPMILGWVVFGCLAYGADVAVTQYGNRDDFWLSIIKTFGPMAGMLAWFMHREKARDEKIFGMLAECTKAITAFNATLSEFRADQEKMRQVLYQLRDLVCGKRMPREGQE